MTWLEVWAAGLPTVNRSRKCHASTGIPSDLSHRFGRPSEPRHGPIAFQRSRETRRMSDLTRLRGFVKDFTDLIDEVGMDEPRILDAGERLLSELVGNDDWLPEAFSAPHPDHYEQYLLHCDPKERFSVVSFVWGPGHTTPIHDHTVWGLVGILRGAERNTEFVLGASGEPPRASDEEICSAGDVARVSPTVGDIHRVSNVADHPSVSIHVYGANIGRVSRHVYDERTGEEKSFISGYSSKVLPNIWG